MGDLNPFPGFRGRPPAAEPEHTNCMERPGDRASLILGRNDRAKDVVSPPWCIRGLAGFVLVFLGVIIATYQSVCRQRAAQVVRPFRTTGGVLFGAFGSAVTVTVCLAWPPWRAGRALRLDDRPFSLCSCAVFAPRLDDAHVLWQ